MAQPLIVEGEFDERGRVVIANATALVTSLSAKLGHTPQAGEKVTLALIEDDALDPQHEDSFGQWLHAVGVPAYEHAKAHPELAMTADDALTRLAAARAQRPGAQ